MWYNGARTFFFVFLFGKNSKTAIGAIAGLSWGTLNLIGSVVAPEFKKSVYDGVKNFAYGAVDVVESGVESTERESTRAWRLSKVWARMFQIFSMVV